MSTDAVFWILAGLQALAAVVRIAETGKDKKPTTPREAAITAVITPLIIWGLYVLWVN